VITKGKIAADLLNLIKGRWQEFAVEWDSRALGTISLGLLALGDTIEAEAALSAALSLNLSYDDWQENDALGELAGRLGEVGDRDGLVWIFTRARERQKAWPQAELAYHVARAATEAGDTTLTSKAVYLMETAALGKTEAISGTNAYGILAVWKAENQDMVAAQELVEQAVAQLKEDPDCADDLAYFALTLAQGQVPELASYVLQQAINVLQQELDPNILGRATGTAAEVAAALDDPKALHLLKTIAKTIDDDWLQAEALFWIAGWEAIMGHNNEARQTYVQAAVSGTWQSLDPTDIEMAWSEENIDWIVEIARNVRWPSTIAAAIFAGLALALARPKPGWIADGLLAIAQITKGYDRIRAVCHRLLLKAATQMSEQPDTAIKYWENALEYNHERDIGEVWAVVWTCLPVLYRQVGRPFVTSLWQELARARYILT
jgi:tetratricopeptide (TPR) repeat protein